MNIFAGLVISLPGKHASHFIYFSCDLSKNNSSEFSFEKPRDLYKDIRMAIISDLTEDRLD